MPASILIRYGDDSLDIRHNEEMPRNTDGSNGQRKERSKRQLVEDRMHACQPNGKRLNPSRLTRTNNIADFSLDFIKEIDVNSRGTGPYVTTIF